MFTPPPGGENSVTFLFSELYFLPPEGSVAAPPEPERGGETPYLKLVPPEKFLPGGGRLFPGEHKYLAASPPGGGGSGRRKVVIKEAPPPGRNFSPERKVLLETVQDII